MQARRVVSGPIYSGLSFVMITRTLAQGQRHGAGVGQSNHLGEPWHDCHLVAPRCQDNGRSGILAYRVGLHECLQQIE